MPRSDDEREWLSRKSRINPLLDSLGWKLKPAPRTAACRIEEYETDHGPADYALCIGSEVLGIVEAKKLSLGPQNVLTQAERYSRGATGSPLNFGGFQRWKTPPTCRRRKNWRPMRSRSWRTRWKS